jgi:hypothetical protein
VAQSIIVVEAGAEPPENWLCPRPDLVVVKEQESETPIAFGSRVVDRIGAALRFGEVAEARYYPSPSNDARRPHVRCVIARALLRAMGTGPRSDLTFVAPGTSLDQPHLFQLVDMLRSELNSSSFAVRLSFRNWSQPPSRAGRTGVASTRPPATLALSG